MATKFDVSALTLNPEEVRDVAQVIIEQAFVNGSLADEHDIQTGIQHKQQIVFLDQLAIGGKALTGCTPAEVDGLVFSQKEWDPALVAGRFTHCANDENKLFKVLKQASNVYPEFFNRLDSPELKLVVSLLLIHMEESIRAKAWFADTAAALTSGAGVFTVGTDLGVFNQIDGIWKQIFADGNVPVYTISENSGASYVLQALTAGEGKTILENVYDNADARLQGDGDAKFYVTPGIYNDFMKSVVNNEINGGIVTTLLNGRPQLSYMGIPLIRKIDWQNNINTYQNNGTVWNLPHRAVLTTPANIPLGTLSTSDFDNLRSIFDEKDNENIIDYGYFLDAKFGESYMASVAY